MVLTKLLESYSIGLQQICQKINVPCFTDTCWLTAKPGVKIKRFWVKCLALFKDASTFWMVTFMLWLAPMKMSTHWHTHVKRHLFIKCTGCMHTHKHTNPSILHRNHSGRVMEMYVLMVSTNGTWQYVTIFLQLDQDISMWDLSAMKFGTDEWGTNDQNLVPDDVMLSRAVPWSADCWSEPLATLCWCSGRRHCRHGNPAARSWHSVRALGSESTVRCSGSGCVSMGSSWLTMSPPNCRPQCCCHYWKTLNLNQIQADRDHYQTSWLEDSAVGPPHCHSSDDVSYYQSASLLFHWCLAKRWFF